ncbi:MAG TPA: hypothetical protein DD723_03175 [Candidatus Omnitrophica bacterium]|nr:MAG: hypothetical protein A2Z81_01100 [Omnitrophica WOR_2 bacterium GWA2_45_18]OGX19258.1 MAG: hypothetical protein A2Y04_00225 [Omnitrophica WOR_2 bacterium GWC2_45_7]HBR14531.1 hypothetical protein [Candidatus Omnitrophota bacterium]
MDYKKIRKIAFIVSLIIISAFIALEVSQYKAFVQAENEWQQKTRELTFVREEIVQIEKLIVDYEKDKEAFEELLFTERDIPAFLDEISKFAKMDHVNLVDMQTQRFYQVPMPEEAVKQSKFASGARNSPVTDAEKEQQKENILTLSAMPIDVKLEGEFVDLANFLGRLQEYKQLTNISDVDIILTGDYPKLSCQFTVNIYSLKTLEDFKIK